MFDACVIGSVCGFAGQVNPVSGDANNIWKNTACASQNSVAAPKRDDIPTTYLEAQGWMLCDGRKLKVSAYPELFAALGYLYGGASDDFCIPDYRGLFLRGNDAGSGMDPDAALRMAPTGSVAVELRRAADLLLGHLRADDVDADVSATPPASGSVARAAAAG